MLKSYYALTPEQLAEYYLQSKGSLEFMPTTAAGLISDIRSYLLRSRLDHRTDEAVEIAQAVLRFAEEIREPEPEPARSPVMLPEEVAWQENIQQGTTATDSALQYELPPRDMRSQLAAFLTGS